MEEKSSFSEKQVEFKRIITDGINNTLPAQVLNKPSNLIKNKYKISWGISMIMLFAIIIFPGLLIAALFHETNEWRISGIPWEVLAAVAGTVVGLLVEHKVISYILVNMRDYVVDAMGRTQDIADLTNQLSGIWDMQKVRKYIYIGGVFWVIINVPGYTFFMGKFPGYGVSMIIFLNGFCFSLLLYGVFWFLRLPSQICQYKFIIYEVDPANSEIVSKISSVMNKAAFMIAAYVALISLSTAIVGDEFLWFNILLVFLLWFPITYFFVSIQNSLRNIINTEKWNTLRNIQGKIRELHMTADLYEKENIDAISRLMDYHDRVKNTRNSALNLKAILNFLNQLMLPLLGFLLANIDTVIDFFR